MRTFLTLLTMVALLASCVFLAKYDTIVAARQGQKEFERLCKEEAGNKLYAVVEKNKGWVVEPNVRGEAWGVARNKNVAFVRYTAKDGKVYDMRDSGNINSPADIRFVETPADLSLQPKYKWRVLLAQPMSDPRFGRNSFEIIDLVSNTVAASTIQFTYQWTKPENVILNAPTAVSCGTENQVKFEAEMFQPGSLK